MNGGAPVGSKGKNKGWGAVAAGTPSPVPANTIASPRGQSGLVAGHSENARISHPEWSLDVWQQDPGSGTGLSPLMELSSRSSVLRWASWWLNLLSSLYALLYCVLWVAASWVGEYNGERKLPAGVCCRMWPPWPPVEGHKQGARNKLALPSDNTVCVWHRQGKEEGKEHSNSAAPGCTLGTCPGSAVCIICEFIYSTCQQIV